MPIGSFVVALDVIGDRGTALKLKATFCCNDAVRQGNVSYHVITTKRMPCDRVLLLKGRGGSIPSRSETTCYISTAMMVLVTMCYLVVTKSTLRGFNSKQDRTCSSDGNTPMKDFSFNLHELL